MFWFGHPFETPLLVQSYVMIAGMIAMMEICIRTKKRNSLYNIPSTSDHSKRLQRRNNRHSRSPTGKLNDVDNLNQNATDSIQDGQSSDRQTATSSQGNRQTQVSSSSVNQQTDELDDQPKIVPEPASDLTQTCADQIEIHLDSVSESSDTNLIESTSCVFHETQQQPVDIESTAGNLVGVNDLEFENPSQCPTPLTGINETTTGTTITRDPKRLVKCEDIIPLGAC